MKNYNFGIWLLKITSTKKYTSWKCSPECFNFIEKSNFVDISKCFKMFLSIPSTSKLFQLLIIWSTSKFFSILNYLVLKFGQLLDIAMCEYFNKKSFSWFGELGSKSRLFLIYQPTPTNQRQIMMNMCLFATLKVYMINYSEYHLLSTNIWHYIAISWKSWKGFELVPSQCK